MANKVTGKILVGYEEFILKTVKNRCTKVNANSLSSIIEILHIDKDVSVIKKKRHKVQKMKVYRTGYNKID